MLAAARAFFAARAILEVDCPALSQAAAVDAHIDPIATSCGRYLSTSPEYPMKRLLASGSGDIYQLAHVFRKGEVGQKHNPEFMMAEWYRVGISYAEMQQESCAFIRLFLGDLPNETLSYRSAFLRCAGIDPFAASEKELLAHPGIKPYPGIEREGRDALLNLILADAVEPRLGEEKLTVLTGYPPSQAALARTIVEEGVKVAERFEIYYKGVELANGYHELNDAAEQRRRFEEANRQREEPLPLDENFLHALPRLPDCCGVAVGFDRLMMLRCGVSGIGEIFPFTWHLA